MTKDLFRKPAFAVVALWVALPILGPLSAILWLVLLPLGYTHSGRRPPWTVRFFAICLAYTAYIIGRSIVVGPIESVGEPLRDVLPLLIIAGVAAWAVKAPAGIDMGRLFQCLSVVMILALFIAVLEREVIDDRYQSQLLLGNPLNLSPLLVIPALLCTYGQFAPTPLWRWIGLAGFAAGAFIISGVSMTRGPFLVMTTLVLLRIVSLLISSGSWGQRLKDTGTIIAVFCLTFGTTLFDQSVVNRFDRLVQTAFNITNYVKSPEILTPQAETITQDSTAIVHNSVSERFSLMQAGWAAFKEKPVFGHGPQYRFDAAVPYFPQPPVDRYSHLHNDFITHLVAGGVVAFIFLMIILMTPFVASLQPGKNRRLRCELGLLFTANFIGVAAVNNVLFVWVSAFTLAISIVAAIVILDDLRGDEGQN